MFDRSFFAKRLRFREVFSVNRFIWILILSALSITFGFSLIEPIFAVFITEQVKGGSLSTVGFASTIFLLTTGLVQIPAGYWIDFSLRFLPAIEETELGS